MTQGPVLTFAANVRCHRRPFSHYVQWILRLARNLRVSCSATLTEGRPRVTDIVPIPGVDASEVLRLAGSLQAGSEHPLAAAMRRRVTDAGVRPPPADDFRALAGRGVSARVEGRRLLFGNLRLLAENRLASAELDAEALALTTSGRTVSWLAEASAPPRLLGLIAFGDGLKPASRAAVSDLRRQHVRTIMLTGDGKGAAASVAASLGIDEVFAEVLPDGKAAAIAGLRQQGHVVAMVGDGINDAPALAAADIGIAMATGTDVAMHTAGITLMRGDPALVAGAIDISRQTWRKIRQGLFWAFAYNAVGIPLAAFGLLSPVLAGAAMALSSVSVVTNALLLRGWRPRAAGDVS